MPKIGQSFKQSEPLPIEPYWSTSDGKTVRLYHGHVVDVLKKLHAKSVHCCVTSSPYWGLRDYQTGSWEGGSPECDHIEVTADRAHKSSTLGSQGKGHPVTNAAYKATVRQIDALCGKCGAERIDQQIGSESTPEEFIEKMVELFSEIKRILRDDGTVWLNLGDTYGSDGLVGIPWRVALALQADGWCLRQDIIWHKPAPMPESVKNRCTKAHEYVFLLTKSMKYFYDAEAIKEKQRSTYSSADFLPDSDKDQQDETGSAATKASRANGSHDIINSCANKRSVWTVASSGYEGAHFAVFPPKLIEPMIKAGTSEKGCCSQCGSPYKRVIEEQGRVSIEDNETKRDRSAGNSNGVGASTLHRDAVIPFTKTVGWSASCECNSSIVPCTVLDPFMGSGTTAAVCIELGRRAVGIDLSEKYIVKNQVPRIEGVLLRRSTTAHLVRKKVQAVKVKPMLRKPKDA
jgi:DNA modification methylase